MKIIRSDRKTASMTIQPDGELLIKAPLNYTEAQAEDFVKRSQGWIDKHRPGIVSKNNLFLTLPKDAEEPVRAAAEIIFTNITQKYAKRMGVTPTSIKITGAEHRFGSCSGKNGICYSWRLMFYPTEAVEYVVAHELTHILHHDHSKAFYKALTDFMPDALERRKLLEPQYASHDNVRKNFDYKLELIL